MSFNTAPIQILPVAAPMSGNVLVQLNSQGQITPCVGLSSDAPVGVTFLPSTNASTVAVMGLGAGILTVKTTGVVGAGTLVYSGVNGTVTATAGSYAIGRAVSAQSAGMVDVMPLLTIGGSANAASGGSSTLVTATGSNTARTLGDRFAEEMDVYDFGAIGDGAAHPISASTAIAYNALFPPLACVAGDYNDWCVLQGVMNLAAVNGKVIHIPAGIFATNHPLTLNWTGTPVAPLPAAPRVTKIYGDGYSSVIVGTITSAGRAVVELLGNDNGNAVNCLLENIRVTMASGLGSNAAYCLRVGDAWTGFKGDRVFCEGANGLLLKVASSVSYANLNTIFSQCRFMSNYGNAWWPNDSLATCYAMGIDTGGSYWDNVRFESCIFGNGVADCRAFVIEFDNCQFYVNPTRAAPYNQNINCLLGSLKTDNCYFEDHDTAIVVGPYVADIRGVTITNCQFTGLTNFPNPAVCNRAIVATGAPNGNLGPVIIEGNKIGSTFYALPCILLAGAQARIGYNTNINHIGTAIRTDITFSNCQISELLYDISGNLICTNTSTFASDAFQKVIANDTGLSSITTAGTGTAAVQWAAPALTATRRGTGIGNGEFWSHATQNSGVTDLMQMGWTSTTYTTGGTISWLANDIPFIYLPLNKKLRISSGASSQTYAEHDVNGITGTGQTFAAQQFQAQVQSIGSVNAATWGYSIQNSGRTDALVLSWASTAYATGGALAWVQNDNPYLYVPTGKVLVIGFGSASWGQFGTTSLYAPTVTASFAAAYTNGVTISSDGLDTLKTVLEFVNIAGNAAFNWQLSTSGHADLWTYNGIAWQDSLRIQKTGECLIGSIVVPPDTFTGNVNWGARSGRVANAGEVGEVIVANAASVAVAGTGTVGNVTSITLTPGSWTITGSYTVNQGATGLTTGTAVNCSIVTTSATDGTQGTTMNQDSALLAVNGFKTMTAPVVTVDISANTTYYLTERVTFGGGAPTVSGTIKGIRRR